MKNLLFVIILGTVIFGDCSKLLKTADPKCSNKCSNKYDNDSYYSIRGQEHYLRYMECSKTEDFVSGY